MSNEILLLLIGGALGFLSSILTIFVIYYIEGLRLQRQWKREDYLSLQSARQDIQKLLQEKAGGSSLTETGDMPDLDKTLAEDLDFIETSDKISAEPLSEAGLESGSESEPSATSTATTSDAIHTSLKEGHRGTPQGPERHPIMADLDLDTLKIILEEETRKAPGDQRPVLIKRLQTAIEWFEKGEAAIRQKTISKTVSKTVSTEAQGETGETGAKAQENNKTDEATPTEPDQPNQAENMAKVNSVESN